MSIYFGSDAIYVIQDKSPSNQLHIFCRLDRDPWMKNAGIVKKGETPPLPEADG